MFFKKGFAFLWSLFPPGEGKAAKSGTSQKTCLTYNCQLFWGIRTMGMCVVFHNYFGKRDTGVSWKTRRHNLVLGGCVKDAFLFFKKAGAIVSVKGKTYVI